MIDSFALLALGGIFLIAVIALILVVKNVLYVCSPSEVLIFSGRGRYRIIKGGRALRVPLIETVDQMDLGNMIIELTVKNAYSKGGIPLTVQGVANTKVPGTAPKLHNALERFLDCSREEIMKVARETLEGNLRGVLATLTPEQVNQDKEAFAKKLTEEAESDLDRIGLVLDTLKIQNVSDDVGYLDAIGRMRSASMLQNAQVVEAETQGEAAEVKWRNYQAGELAKLEAEVNVAIKENERRVADAQTKRAALIEEEKAVVRAEIAQAEAELQLEEARIEQTRLRLEADLIQPAEAAKQEAVQRAKANAVHIVEQGRATASMLKGLARSYRENGTAGRDLLLMQKLIPLLNTVSGTIGELKIDRLTIIGQNGSNGSAPFAAQLVGLSEQVKAATGIDVPEVLRTRLGVDAHHRESIAHEPVPHAPTPPPIRAAPQTQPKKRPAPRPQA